MINGHVAFKLVYIRIFSGTDRMHKRDWVGVGSWIGIALSLWIIAWIIAEAIPVFENLLSLITALFASWFTYGLSGIFWLYMNWGMYFSSPRKIILTFVNLFIVGIGGCLVSSLSYILVVSCRRKCVLIRNSAALVSTSLGRPFTTTPPVPASHAGLATLDFFVSLGYIYT